MTEINYAKKPQENKASQGTGKHQRIIEMELWKQLGPALIKAWLTRNKINKWVLNFPVNNLSN